MALSCYRCGTSLSGLTLPLSRLDECPGCGVQLHVCRMCVSYAPDLPEACSEDDAPEVRDKTNANFCDYFKPSEWAYRPSAVEAESAAKAELRALFGEDTGDAASDDADGEGTGQDTPAAERAPARRARGRSRERRNKTPEEIALEQARSLFKK